MKTAKIKIKGKDVEFTFDELQDIEDQINDAQGGFLKDFGDSKTLAEFVKKRKYADKVKKFGESETFMDFLNSDGEK